MQTMKTPPLPCNLGMYVSPNSFSVDQFELFSDLSVEQEFDLVAPVFIYFAADMKYKKRAHVGLTELKKLGHPLMDGREVNEVLEQNDTLDHLETRYNALMMALVDQVIPGVDSYIDQWGAYSFRVPGDDTLLSGDASGTFAFYENAESVKGRIAATSTETA